VERRSHIERSAAAARQELVSLEVRRVVCVGLARLLPSFTLNRVRGILLRASGWRVLRASAGAALPDLWADAGRHGSAWARTLAASGRG